MDAPDERPGGATDAAPGSLVLGAVLTLTDQLRTLGADASATEDVAGDAPSPDTPDADRLRHLAIGLTLASRDRAVEASQLVGTVMDTVRPTVDRLTRIGPLGSLRRRAERQLEGLVQRGEVEERRSRERVELTFGATIHAVTASSMVDDVVNDVVGRALDPILATALPRVLDDLGDQPELLVPLVESIVGAVLQPILQQAIPQVMDQMEGQPELLLPLVEAIVNEALEPILQDAMPKVLAMLNEDPDAIRSLVRDQSTGIAVEMTDTVRVRAATADERIDRIVRRVLRRAQPELEIVVPSRPALPAAPIAGEVIDVQSVVPSTGLPRVVGGGDDPDVDPGPPRRDDGDEVDGSSRSAAS